MKEIKSQLIDVMGEKEYQRHRIEFLKTLPRVDVGNTDQMAPDVPMVNISASFHDEKADKNEQHPFKNDGKFRNNPVNK